MPRDPVRHSRVLHFHGNPESRDHGVRLHKNSSTKSASVHAILNQSSAKLLVINVRFIISSFLLIFRLQATADVADHFISYALTLCNA